MHGIDETAAGRTALKRPRRTSSWPPAQPPSVIAWRMRGKVQLLATYPQARLRMTAVRKTAASTSPATAAPLA